MRRSTRRLLPARHGGECLRVVVSFPALAFFVDHVGFVAAAVDLDAAHGPALVGEHLGQFVLRLPGCFSTGIAGCKSGRHAGSRYEHSGRYKKCRASSFHRHSCSVHFSALALSSFLFSAAFIRSSMAASGSFQLAPPARAMNATARAKSSSAKSALPPLGGMARSPNHPSIVSVTCPSLISGAHAFLSPNFGALATPAAWQVVQMLW